MGEKEREVEPGCMTVVLTLILLAILFGIGGSIEHLTTQATRIADTLENRR